MKYEMMNFLEPLLGRNFHHPKPQVGIVLTGTLVDQTVIGGPAHSSKIIFPGDAILKIDGIIVTSENIRSQLLGCDIPGSTVILTLGKGGPKVQCISPRSVRE
jgi:hypothetical protein